MSMNWYYASALFLSALASLSLSVIAWKRRNAPGGNNLAYLGVAITVWALSYCFYWLTPNPETKRFWLHMAYMGANAVPTIFLVFTLRYTNRGSLIKPGTILLLTIEPFLATVLIWTDPYTNIFFAGRNPTMGLIFGGAVFWFHIAYSYVLLLCVAVMLIKALISTPRPLRGQVNTILMGLAVPWLANIVYLFGWHPFPNLDLTPFAFTITCLSIVIGLSQYRLLDIVPVARSVLFERIEDLVIVLDKHNRLVDINPTALKLLGGSVKGSLVGLPIDELFSKNYAIFDRFRDTLVTRQEVFIEGTSPIYLDLNITPLYDGRGQYSGRVIVGRDITSRKIALQAEHEQRILAEALRETASMLSSSRTFDEILDCVLDNVDRVVPYDIATFMLLDEHGIAHAARARGYKENNLAHIENLMHLKVDDLPNFRHMIETGQAVVVSDTHHSSDWVRVPGLESLASYVGAPVRVKGIVVGFLDLISLTAGFFTQTHADRLQTFADQTAIAIENARLIEEAQRRAEEMSMLFDIGLTITSGQNMNQILRSLLEKCQQVLPVEVFYVAVYDPGTGMINHPLFYDLGNFRQVPSRNLLQSPGMSGRVIQTRQSFYIPDLLVPEVEKEYQILHAGGTAVRSYVGVPMVLGDRAVGAISMQSYQPNAYNSAQIRLLKTIATQTAIAIENARLLEEARRRADEMTALFDIGVTVTSGLEMDRTLRALLEKCQQVLPIEAFYVAVLDPETNLIHHPLAYDLGEYPKIPTRDLGKTPGLSGYIINSRQPLYIPDMTSPEALKTYQIFRTSGTPTRSFVGVPMIVGEQVVGVISMQSYKPDAYDIAQIRLLETIAAQAAVAIENSRLYRELKQELGDRKKAEHRYRALFEQSHDAVFILDFQGKHLEANQRATELLGYSHEELLQLHASDISAQKEESNRTLVSLLAGEHVPLYERSFKKKNGEIVIVEINVELVRDENGEPLHIQSVLRDITSRKQDEDNLKKANRKLKRQIAEIEFLQAQLREQAIRDPLTGLYNRRYLEETLERDFAEADRQDSSVCLVMMDIDGFKGFNDTYGHDAGDYMLKKLGTLLQGEVRRSDVACRFGGEEFVIVMPGAPLEKGLERAEQLRRTFELGDFEYVGEKLKATLSLGVASYPKHGANWQEVLHAADRAMYRAKDAGRNCARSAGD